MNIKNSEMCKLRRWKYWNFFNNIWATFRDCLGSFFLFMLCCNVNEQMKRVILYCWKLYWINFNKIFATFRGFFSLFMLCSNVNEQFKFRKCVKCDFQNIEGWGGVVFFLFMRCSNVYEQFKFRKCVKCDFENIEGWGWGC